MNGFDYGERMQEIMDARGLKPSDFYNDGNYKSSDGELITKTRFHMVLKGKTKDPAAGFIPQFCKIAGITVGEFYRETNLPDEFTCSLTEEEKEFIVTIRELREKRNDDRIYDIIKAYLNGLATVKD